MSFPNFVTLRVALDGVKAEVLHCFADYAEVFNRSVEEAFSKVDVAECVREQAERLIPEVVEEKVRQRLSQVSWDLVEKAWGRDKYAQAIDRLVRRLRREALTLWEEDFKP